MGNPANEEMLLIQGDVTCYLFLTLFNLFVRFRSLGHYLRIQVILRAYIPSNNSGPH